MGPKTVLKAVQIPQRIKRAPLLFFLQFGLMACTASSGKDRYLLGEKLWSDSKYAAAVSEFEKAASKDPRSSLGVQALFRAAATRALYLGQPEEAIREFRTVTERTENPKLKWEAEKQIADLFYSRMNQHDAAIHEYRAMIQSHPDSIEEPEFLFRIGRSQFLMSRFDDAIEAYRGLVKKYGQTSWGEKAALELGIVDFTRGGSIDFGDRNGSGYSEAMSIFEKFIRTYPQSKELPQARFYIASCLEEMDQLEPALKKFEELINFYPDPNVVRVKIARIRDRMNQRNR